MKAEKALPVLVYCDAGLTVLAIVVDHALSWFLPAPLREFLDTDVSVASRAAAAVLMGLWVVVVAATVLAWIGLLNLRPWARALYFWSWVATLLLIPFERAWVFSSPGYLLDAAATLVGGTLLGVLYFSEARTHFEPAPAAAPVVQPHVAA